MTVADTPLWLLADQLGPHFHSGDHPHRPVLLVESATALRRRRFHRQKLHLILSALRHTAADLGERATLIKADTYTEALEHYRQPVLVYEPTSFAADRFVQRLRADGRVVEILPTPGFALPRKEFRQWAGGRKRFRLEDFYRDQRRRFGVLMDGDHPVGGRWNFDTDTIGSALRRAARRWRWHRRTTPSRTLSTPGCVAISTRWRRIPSAWMGRDCSPPPPRRPERRWTSS